ncbi:MULTISPECIES: glutathione transferase GstA [unclassified Novosphingobium]|uniref:glutathione transferase GstA n=1 Tax=unclassified Novosphingobium TaxID=2644732 RepID=UPI00135737B4|nr:MULTISPECIES: glutathione transferase GstA [unclassified Novosphingobium]
MKLYYTPGACSLADHIALTESGLSFEADKVDLKDKTTENGGDYAAINPKGYVPALGLDDGGVLTENVAILTYISDRSGRLMPGGDLGRYRLLEALAYISTELHKGFAPFFKPGSSDEDKAAARKTLGNRFALFEEQIDGQEFILGPEMSVADCYLFVMLFWAKGKVDLDLPPNLTSYFDRLSKREGVRKALSEEGLD